jgi:hypothetical protein
MSKEKGKELFRALNVILDAVSSLNLRDLEAEAKADRGESSSKAAAEFSKGKDKVAEPNWEDIPFNPVPITLLSSRPRFTHVVGSSSEAMAPSRIGATVIRPPGGGGDGRGRGLGGPPGGGPPGGGPPGGPRRSPSRSPSLGRSPSPSGSGNNGNGDGDGDGLGGGLGGGGGLGAGGTQPGGGAQQQPLAYNTAAQFLGMWNNCATDVARQSLEQQAINRSPVAEVEMAAMVKINLRLQATVGALTGQVGAAQAAAAAANQAAVNAQAVATAAGNVDRFGPAAPPRYGNKKKDAEVKQWIPIIKDNYLRTAPDADYIRLASSYLEGGPRSLWNSVYEAYKAANGGAKPAQPRVFFRETLENNYGLQDLEQKYLDTWNSLRQGPTQDIAEYNVEFQQALTDLAGSVTDEQVKIEKYRSGLQHDLRELCRTSPNGARWAHLTDLIQYATLQWPVIQERVSRRKKHSSGETSKVAGKRKSSGGGAGGSGRSSSKARLGASGTPLTEEQKKRDFELKLCHKCHQPGQQMKQCPLNKKKGGKVAAVASGSAPKEDGSSEEDF